jgi:hypothetical protein
MRDEAGRQATLPDGPPEPRHGLGRDSLIRLPTSPRNETRVDGVNALLP